MTSQNKKMSDSTKATMPTVLLIFGATGDLMAKKIAPALFHLYQKKKLPKYFNVIGFSRRNLSHKAFQDYVLKLLQKHNDIKAAKKQLNEFIQYFSYTQGLFQNKKAYQTLQQRIDAIDAQWKVCSNKLFYLAVPPQFYEVIFKNLAYSGLTKPCSDEEGWTRVLVEKPFGKDLKTAQHLDTMLSKLFREEQIYRIDHYLAKEMLQNILAFRFCNNILEHDWNSNFIKKVDIRLLEDIGVKDRGSFYDGLGALRDVGQNHLLQMLALIAMDQPRVLDPYSIRDKRSRVLQDLAIPTKQDITQTSIRAQYKGYRNTKGVKIDSQTETYFKVQAYINADRWHGVPFILESGKRLKDARKEIVVTFKHHMPCLCPPDAQEHYKNKVVFSLEPQESIQVYFWSKKPGLKMEFEQQVLNFVYRKKQQKTQYTEEYEKLLLDAMMGDQTLFVSTSEVEYMWRFIDPIISAWQNNAVPLETYEPDTTTILKRAPVFKKPTTKLTKHIGVHPPVIPSQFKKHIGIVGLGKMGANIGLQLIEKGWHVTGYNKTAVKTKKLEQQGISGAYSLKELVKTLESPRIVWLMIPAGKPVDSVLFSKNGLVNYLDKGDMVIDGGNSFYKDSVKRYKKLEKKRIHFIDVGVSGGPKGARYGACLMVGGAKKIYNKLLPLFKDISVKDGVAHFSGAGAGHFVKMVHNGIEYGMMQAIAEGFTILKNADYNLDLKAIAQVYNHGSVIESRLISWLKNSFELYGQSLKGVSGKVGHTGEGAWTVKIAKEMDIKAKIIKRALDFRVQSEKNPSYTGKILSALREQFGGHKVK